ncbi:MULTISPECIES: transporter [Kangiella]|uniref:Transporter n=1 Tax=Kangiella koreensis (strain DSM 16069 / JCM 12317 / KCTC 12182 / SW-125) TaxID=523791 RepID=C7RBU7_KANKD|nr:transporter [Kangiella koreensis]ACV26739.1 hypothetical protein Kkor_1325 [Kangiella koreensis DSM 16069]
MLYKQSLKQTITAMGCWLFLPVSLFAHDPIFSPGPHVLFKDGFEIHTEFVRSEQGDESDSEQAIALKYGITGDWVIGIEQPYQIIKDEFGSQSGVGDILLSTKYRFWREDTPGVQESAAVLVKVKLDSSNDALTTDTVDPVLGFTYGYESLTWYRFNQNNDQLQRGDRLFVDLAGGYRSQLNDYREADTVWLLELNGEFIKRNAFNGLDLNNTGGNQWFVSPGIMLTYRNFAVKAGIQLPVLSNLNGDQPRADYRARQEFEWHL